MALFSTIWCPIVAYSAPQNRKWLCKWTGRFHFLSCAVPAPQCYLLPNHIIFQYMPHTTSQFRQHPSAISCQIVSFFSTWLKLLLNFEMLCETRTVYFKSKLIHNSLTNNHFSMVSIFQYSLEIPRFQSPRIYHRITKLVFFHYLTEICTSKTKYNFVGLYLAILFAYKSDIGKVMVFIQLG